ncbi:MAG: TIGR02757 family protein [Desulfobacteraceae bacterium 4484_190.3]|nr:MAG: TIGR02757 family protein [Desulfobacteraceae bacterium 4484_190.3]
MNAITSSSILEETLEYLYGKYNIREFVHPDPLEFLYDYEDLRDREIVGLIASSLAYGRVFQINRSGSIILDRMTPSPFGFLEVASMESLLRTFSSFKHRFTTGEEIAAMLFGMKNVIMKYGSLYACFKAGFINNGESILPAITEFVEELSSVFNCRSNSLLPSPAKGSACKRINLFLRWMVRRDDVDPGGWDDIPPSELVIPLDTHMHKICLAFGFTKRKQADMKTALEITDAFRKIAPHDPVRYDFSLTRLGIREDMNITSFLDEYDTRTAVQHNRKSAYETC